MWKMKTKMEKCRSVWSQEPGSPRVRAFQCSMLMWLTLTKVKTIMVLKKKTPSRSRPYPIQLEKNALAALLN